MSSAGPRGRRPGDEFLGSDHSITEQYQYSTYLELYLTTRFPDWDLVFLNAGIGGDTANGGAGRFASHVLAEKPTAVTINFGMNDAGYQKFNPATNKVYAEKTAAMLQAAKAAGVRVALVSPNAVDRRKSPGFSDFKVYVETQKQFYAPLQGLAGQHGARFVDQYAVTRAAVEKMEADKADTVVPYYDGFHTSPPGGLLMAHAILTGLGAPAKVSDVLIDARAKTARGDRCRVEDLNVTEGAISFTRLDEALPLPVQKDWVSILPYVNNLADLNWYGLAVGGLPAGTYEVSLDGAAVMKATAEDLAKGINLGNLTTGPVHARAQKVFEAIQAKNQLVHRRFRDVVMFNVPAWMAEEGGKLRAAELAKRTEAINARQADVYKLARPEKVKVELKLQK